MRKSPSNKNIISLSYLEVVAKLEAYCAYQDRSRKEVQQKLVQYALSVDQNEMILHHLLTNRFLDEERFVESFVWGKFRVKKWGRHKIKAELKNKGISTKLADQYLSQLSGDEYMNTIHGLIEKKYKLLSAEKDPFAKKTKVIRFLASKGFELDLIQDAYSAFQSKNH